MASEPIPITDPIKFGDDFELDLRAYELRRGGRALRLSRIPMDMLVLLVEHRGALVSREQIIEKIWGKDVFLDTDGSINSAIRRLRQVLKDNPERPRHVQTVVGKGYRFIAAIRRSQSPHALAVLPFKPLGGGDHDEYLELGMADALIMKLSTSGRLIVRPTSAIRKYAGAGCDTLAAGRALQVDSILEGNIQRSSDRLRVSIRLIRVSDGASLWSDSYDSRFTDVFQVQDTVSERVVDALAVELSSLDKAGLRKRYTASVQAYELYMRGIFFWNKRNEDGLRKAVSYFERAIAVDDNYALAHAGLAAALCPLGYLGYSAPAEVRPKIRAAAARAVSLDPTLPDAHVALAAVLAFYEWNWPEGEREFQRAIEMNPNLPLSHHWYGMLLECLGRYEDALKRRERAQELDPISPIIVYAMGRTLFLLGENDRALTQFRKALELDNSLHQAHLGIGDVYERRSELGPAISEYRLAVECSSESPLARAALGHALAHAGGTSEAKQILNELLDASHTRYVSHHHLAIVCAGLGDGETALNWLENAYDQGASTLCDIVTEPRLQILRAHPRFRKLLQRMGLAAAIPQTVERIRASPRR